MGGKEEKIKSYFIRHTDKLAISEETMNEIWNEDKFFIHYPVFDLKTGEESRTSEPNEYPTRGGKRSIKILLEISKNGGYVWSECWTQDIIKVGYVKPGTKIKFKVTKCGNQRYKEDLGKKVILKYLPFEKIRIIKPRDAMSLKCTRPRGGTIGRWPSVKNRLKALVKRLPFDKEWDSLSTDVQEIVCVEFLRNQKDYKNIPRLSNLLMPTGRTMKDIDIYGINKEGKEIFCQVTHYKINEFGAEEKIEKLKNYLGSNIIRILFCDSDDINNIKNIIIFPVDFVFSWLKKNDVFYNKIFSI